MKRMFNLLLSALFFSPIVSYASTCDSSTVTFTNHTNQPLVFTNLSTSQIAPFQNIPGGSIVNFQVGQQIDPNSSITAKIMTGKGSRGDAFGLMTFQLGSVQIYVDYSFSTNDTFGISPCLATKQITQDSGLNQIVVTSSIASNSRPPAITVDVYQVYSGPTAG